MPRYEIEIEYHKHGEKTYSMTHHGDYILENGTYEELCWHMRRIINDCIEEGMMNQAEAYDMLGDIPMFNEFMESMT
ncbi:MULTISPECIES: hypothetical protein [unclassified Granulicatella]|uniref:hypothetical protein n=1 Tax=unclassified Granulicatella TaxID=2630493 RepID=UPI0010741E8E|nr:MULTISPECIES: hypothetical protein [unclassified Granulicatella]MBF0780677.1 hypothetical protein [Granulicatella sp. 19428wC4_WM01]TFU94254.1 hypothetical protein E4T68_06165 [Granulicatella sp. WM01]